MKMFEEKDGLNKNATILSENLTVEQRLELYEKWAESYDKDMRLITYDTHSLIAETLASHLNGDRSKWNIIDVAAGTGLQGEELYNAGFRTIDAVEPVQKMLDIAEQKAVYRRCICDYVTENPLDIPDVGNSKELISSMKGYFLGPFLPWELHPGIANQYFAFYNQPNFPVFATMRPSQQKPEVDNYDGLTICGGFGYGHIPCGALYELIRLVKPGGYIVMATNPLYLDTCPEYKGQFKALIDRLVTERKWKEIKTDIIPNYAPNVNGILMVYQKL